MPSGVGAPVQLSYSNKQMFIVPREMRWWFQSLLFKTGKKILHYNMEI
jgi:hypothetical protein